MTSGHERDAVRQTASAATGGRALQAGRDLTVHEVHHHRPVTETAVLVEPVLPAAETVAEVFVGRDAEVDAVLGILAPDTDSVGMVVVSAVAGLAGIGKTALARVSASEGVARGWFPGGAVFVDLNGYAPDPDHRIRPHQAYAPMLHALDRQGPPDTAPQGHAAQYHRFLAERAAEDRPVLLVLDNASTTDQIADLLPRSRIHRVVVTSRHTLAARGSRTLDLRTLASGDSVSLIRDQLDLLSAGDIRLRDDPEGTRRLCELCGHLPLALHITAALLARDPGLTPTDLADDLAQAHGRLDLLDDGERAVRAAFDLSYLRLTKGQARLFRLLPINPGPHFGLPAAARLLDTAPRSARPLLLELARAHVIEQAGPGKWRQHDLIRAYAIEHLADHGDSQDEPARRLLTHYALEGRRAGQALLVVPGGGPPQEAGSVQQALDWFDQELPNLQAAIAMGLTFDHTTDVLRMLEALIRFHRHRGQTTELVETCRKVATVAAGSLDGSHWALTGLTWTLGALGLDPTGTGGASRLVHLVDIEATDPFFEHPASVQLWGLLETVRAHVDALPPSAQVTAVPMLHEIARTAYRTGAGGSTSIQALLTAVRISERSEDHHLLTESWLLLGHERLRLDRRPAAERSLKEAYRCLQNSIEPDSARWRELCYRLLTLADGIATESAARIKAEARAITEAVAMDTHAGGHVILASALDRTGTERYEAADYARAVTRHQKALRLREEHLPKDRKAIGRTLLRLSLAHFGVGNHAAAAETAERATTLLAETGEAHSSVRARELLVYALLALHRTEEAVEVTYRARQRASVEDDTHAHISAVLLYALALRESGRHSSAYAAARQALQLARSGPAPDLHAYTRDWLRREGLPTPD
ncbi:ATP-binding protein [Streptomyces atriruber]|uniref:ATP-binding protein n=1 Tax=Streptomyces atriruber TaxID=545121 RepID=UPI0006E3EFBF|nr:ATP-binding protein [Streptomyces atriruber]